MDRPPEIGILFQLFDPGPQESEVLRIDWIVCEYKGLDSSYFCLQSTLCFRIGPNTFDRQISRAWAAGLQDVDPDAGLSKLLGGM